MVYWLKTGGLVPVKYRGSGAVYYIPRKRTTAIIYRSGTWSPLHFLVVQRLKTGGLVLGTVKFGDHVLYSNKDSHD